MNHHTLIALCAASFAFIAVPALTHAAPAQTRAAAPNPRVKIETTQGAIVLELDAHDAPITVANYLKYVDRGLFNGAVFYRASRPQGYSADDYGLIQGGLQNDPKKVLPPIAHEPTTKTGLTHKVDGVISMGRNAPGTAQADWSITLGDMSYLDADPKNPKANPGFAAFGRVVEGLDVVKKILVLPTDPNKGVGAMHGEMLKRPVRMLSVSRVAAPSPVVQGVPAPQEAPTPTSAAPGPPS